MQFEKELWLYSEYFWYHTLINVRSFIRNQIFVNLSGKYERVSFTYNDIKEILVFLDSLIGYRINDPFEYEYRH